MEESPANATRDPAPPAPPRWKGIQSLDLVHQLNERCIELVCDVAAAETPASTLPIVIENRELWVRLGTDARHAIAQMPFIIVEAHFRNAAWWRRVSANETTDSATEVNANGLPRDASEHLMHETTMFA